MAQTSGTLWNEAVIVPNEWSYGQLVTPEVKATATYVCERTGSTLKIKVDTSNHCTSRGAYWDWRWAFSVSVNGTEIANNIQIKPRTYLNTIGTTHYDASTGWCYIDIGTANQITVAVSYFDTEASNAWKQRRAMGGGTVVLGNIPQIPSVSDLAFDPLASFNVHYPMSRKRHLDKAPDILIAPIIYKPYCALVFAYYAKAFKFFSSLI